MFLGRLGPMTFLQIFQANMDKKQSLHYEYVEEDFLIG
jgi:Trk-type K+ transport system membrane component